MSAVGYLNESLQTNHKLSQESFYVTQAHADEAEAITTLINTTFAKCDKFRLKDSLRIPSGMLQVWFPSKEHYWYVVKTQSNALNKMPLDTIVGVLIFSNESKEIGSIHLLAVEEKYRGHGRTAAEKLNLGSLLLKAAEIQAFKEKKVYIRIQVAHINEKLIKFYESKGYKQTGEKAPFFRAEETELQEQILSPEYRHKGTEAPKLFAVTLTKNLQS